MRGQSYKSCIGRRGAEQERANRFRSGGIETEAYILRLRTVFENWSSLRLKDSLE